MTEMDLVGGKRKNGGRQAVDGPESRAEPVETGRRVVLGAGRDGRDG